MFPPAPHRQAQNYCREALPIPAALKAQTWLKSARVCSASLPHPNHLQAIETERQLYG